MMIKIRINKSATNLVEILVEISTENLAKMLSEISTEINRNKPWQIKTSTQMLAEIVQSLADI